MTFVLKEQIYYCKTQGSFLLQI